MRLDGSIKCSEAWRRERRWTDGHYARAPTDIREQSRENDAARIALSGLQADDKLPLNDGLKALVASGQMRPFALTETTYVQCMTEAKL